MGGHSSVVKKSSSGGCRLFCLYVGTVHEICVIAHHVTSLTPHHLFHGILLDFLCQIRSASVCPFSCPVWELFLCSSMLFWHIIWEALHRISRHITHLPVCMRRFYVLSASGQVCTPCPAQRCPCAGFVCQLCEIIVSMCHPTILSDCSLGNLSGSHGILVWFWAPTGSSLYWCQLCSVIICYATLHHTMCPDLFWHGLCYALLCYAMICYVSSLLCFLCALSCFVLPCKFYSHKGSLLGVNLSLVMLMPLPCFATLVLYIRIIVSPLRGEHLRFHAVLCHGWPCSTRPRFRLAIMLPHVILSYSTPPRVMHCCAYATLCYSSPCLLCCSGIYLCYIPAP